MSIKVFATCPQSKDVDSSTYLRAVADVARWSEAAGCAGILVYTDNGIVDPWLVSQVILQHTQRLGPLVAIQPVYTHPYTAAKMVASLAFMHGRRVYLNMLAGGFKNDLIALGDQTPHDERYARTTEYTQIMMGLLAGGPVTLHGAYYQVTNLRLTPAVPPDLVPEVLISGSSPAGLAAAKTLGAIPVKYPKPPGEEEPVTGDGPAEFGVRVGIVARERADEAWRVALERFPEDRKGQITHKLAMSVSDSHWHRQLSRRGHARPGEAESEAEPGEPNPYWLGPFQNYKTFCPYLVGSYERVAAELSRYVQLGTTTFILDIPASQTELEHIGIVFEQARHAAVGA
ncbi:MAG: LLM class flavin-dependent oxidoreductase [Egibacteraceae bacterium]